MAETPTRAVTEREKYAKCWADPRYANYSPGEAALHLFRDMVRKRSGTLVDLGCGTGRAGAGLSTLGFEVTLMDFASAPALDEGAQALPFIDRNLCGHWDKQTWDWGYCCDVMEHLPTVQVHPVLQLMSEHCRQLFFTIHFGPDHFGKIVGHPLHLTVKPFSWWRDSLRLYGRLVEARDLLGMGAFRLESVR